MDSLATLLFVHLFFTSLLYVLPIASTIGMSLLIPVGRYMHIAQLRITTDTVGCLGTDL